MILFDWKKTLFRSFQAPVEIVILKVKFHSQPTWGVQQPQHLIEIGHVLLIVLGAVSDGADLVHGGDVNELGHCAFFWIVAHQGHLQLQILRHCGTYFVLCGEKNATTMGH